MIEFEIPRSLRPLIEQAHQVAKHVFRPIARRHDGHGHAYPKELDMLAALLDGVMEAGGMGVPPEGRIGRRRPSSPGSLPAHLHLAATLGMMELAWGDLGLALTIPRQGLGNVALVALASPEQRARFGPIWAAMAAAEPGASSDRGALHTTARLEGDVYVLDGEKSFVTTGSRADAVVVWARLEVDGVPAARAFLVPRGTPGLELVGLDAKLGARAADAAHLRLRGCRVPRGNLLGGGASPERLDGGIEDVANRTRLLAAAMSVGVARAALDLLRPHLEAAGVRGDYERPLLASSAAEAALYRMETDVEAAYLLTLEAAHLADQGAPYRAMAAMAKAKAARVAGDVTLRAVELAGDAGYAERELLEKWARDAQALALLEGTRAVQLLVVARELFGLDSDSSC